MAHTRLATANAWRAAAHQLEKGVFYTLSFGFIYWHSSYTAFHLYLRFITPFVMFCGAHMCWDTHSRQNKNPWTFIDCFVIAKRICRKKTLPCHCREQRLCCGWCCGDVYHVGNAGRGLLKIIRHFIYTVQIKTPSDDVFFSFLFSSVRCADMGTRQVDGMILMRKSVIGVLMYFYENKMHKNDEHTH